MFLNNRKKITSCFDGLNIPSYLAYSTFLVITNRDFYGLFVSLNVHLQWERNVVYGDGGFHQTNKASVFRLRREHTENGRWRKVIRLVNILDSANTVVCERQCPVNYKYTGRKKTKTIKGPSGKYFYF